MFCFSNRKPIEMRENKNNKYSKTLENEYIELEKIGIKIKIGNIQLKWMKINMKIRICKMNENK